MVLYIPFWLEAKWFKVIAMETEYEMSKIYPQRVFIWSTLSSQRDKFQFHDSAWPRIICLSREFMLIRLPSTFYDQEVTKHNKYAV